VFAKNLEPKIRVDPAGNVGVGVREVNSIDTADGILELSGQYLFIEQSRAFLPEEQEPATATIAVQKIDHVKW
jgi:hypothetical protein